MRAQRGFTLIELLVVLMVIGVLVALVALNIDPILGIVTGRGQASELETVQKAISSYNTQDVTVDGAEPIPGRFSAAPITPGDEDAPFSKYLRRATRYSYTWDAGGDGLTLYDGDNETEMTLASFMSTVLPIIETELNKSDTFDTWGYGARNWNRRIERMLEQGTLTGPFKVADGDNILGYTNPISGKGSIFDLTYIPDRWIGTYSPPAVMITNNSAYAPDSATLVDDENMVGTLIVYRADENSAVQVFYVRSDGSTSSVKSLTPERTSSKKEK